MTEPKSYTMKEFQGCVFIGARIIIFIPFRKDKKSKLANKVAKENLSETTSLSNNAIQNAKGLSKVNKHNLRDYDNQKELVKVIYGTDIL